MNFFNYSCLTDKIQKFIYNFWLFLKYKLSLAVYGILPNYMSKKFTLRSRRGETCSCAQIDW